MKNPQDAVAALKWFHAIDFGEIASSGRFEAGKPQNTTLYATFEFLQAMELAGARVLDIGTCDGIVAFGAHKLGAKSVAVDAHDNPAFHLAREILGLTIDYTPNVQIADLLDKFGRGSFDVIVCAGVIYHMLMPMQAFTETRKMLRDGGYLIMETPYDHTEKRAILHFNGIEKIVPEPLTYFVPSRSALVGMANLSGFKLIATRVLTGPRRITLLLKAMGRKELAADAATPPFVVQMLKRDTCDNEFRFRQLEQTPVETAAVSVHWVPEYREIVAATEAVTFPYHPPIDRPAYGSTRFETAKGNTKVL